ncbi:hypothetical protein, partial [Enterobacter hormaechei]
CKRSAAGHVLLCAGWWPPPRPLPPGVGLKKKKTPPGGFFFFKYPQGRPPAIKKPARQFKEQNHPAHKKK